MMYKKGDRVLFNRLDFGTIHSDQFDYGKVDVVLDRDRGTVKGIRPDMLELVADARHEETLSALIVTDLFGEEYSGFALHSCRVRKGTAYWVTETVDDTRHVYDQHTLMILWDDGSEGDGVVKLKGQGELDAWTKYL